VRDLLAQGRAEAEAEHARIVATARRRAEHRAEQTLDAARTRAAEILRTGEERMPGLVDEVLACLREDLS
jgi:vacuolar-type H+-ATPase subunit H